MAGSTFKFEITIKHAHAIKPPTFASSPPLSPVLIVAQRQRSAEMVMEIVTSYQIGGSICIVPSAAIAELARARQSGEAYRALLLDVECDDALELVRQLRLAGESIPVVLLVGPSAVANCVALMDSLGQTSYLIKPVKRALLFRALATTTRPILAKERSGSQVQASASILLVEDNVDNRLLIETYLKKSPHRVFMAADGAEALQQFQLKPFDLVLMDMQMPVMDGYAATRAIRAWEIEQGRKPTPVIALTANAVREDLSASLAAGCDEHLTKPIKKQLLLQVIARWLETAERKG